MNLSLPIVQIPELYCKDWYANNLHPSNMAYFSKQKFQLHYLSFLFFNLSQQQKLSQLLTDCYSTCLASCSQFSGVIFFQTVQFLLFESVCVTNRSASLYFVLLKNRIIPLDLDTMLSWAEQLTAHVSVAALSEISSERCLLCNFAGMTYDLDREWKIEILPEP